MKVAIIGSNSYAMRAEQMFRELQANVKVFSDQQKPVSRVHKKSLALTEEPTNSSRFSDLFRVVYEVIPDKDLNNNELIEKLPKDVRESLSSSIESYEDFDLIVDAKTWTKSQPFLGAHHGPAVNELKYKELIQYNVETIDQGMSDISVFCNSEQKLKELYKLEDWLFYNEGNCLTLVSYGMFEKSECYHSYLGDLISKSDADFEVKRIAFEKELHEWKQMEDYIRVKYKRPEEPTRKLEILDNLIPVSVDYLVDRKKLYISLEENPFSKKLAPTGKTLSSDLYLCLNNFSLGKKEHPFENCRIGYNKETVIQEEKGIFFIGNPNLSIETELEQVKNEVFKLFTKNS